MFNFLKRKPKQADTFIFKPDEQLPIGVWAYFVKRRANFRCEECGKSCDVAHHIIHRPKGKNTLRNGIALCYKCHGKIHHIVIPVKYKDSKLPSLLGKRWYNNTILKEIEEIEEYKCLNCVHSRIDLKRYFSCEKAIPTKGECPSFERTK